MIENASLAVLFAIVAPFVVSFARKSGWSTQRVQVAAFLVAFVFAAVAVFVQAGEVTWSALTTDEVLGYFAAIAVLSQSLYVFVLKPSANAEKPLTLPQQLNELLLRRGNPAPPPGSQGGVPPPPGGD